MAKFKISTEEQTRLKEYARCKKDPVYFIENYVYIPTVGGDEHPKLYTPQKGFVDTLLNKHNVIALKSRQIGISTISQLYCCWVMTFYKNVIVGIVSRDGPEASDFATKATAMIRGLPKWMQPKFVRDNVKSCILDNGCQMWAETVNEKNPSGLFRGKAITVLILDEAAFIRRIDEAYTGCAPALLKSQTTAKKNGVPHATIIISTPNKTVGLGKWYYRKWVSAINKVKSADDVNELGGGIFYPVKIHWKDVAEFRDDPTWYPTQCEMLDNVQWKIDQELEMKFVASHNSFLPPETIDVLNDCDSQPVRIHSLKKKWELRQFTEIDRSKYVMIGIDTAGSSGADYSTIQVLDFETMDQIAEFKDKLRVDDFCEVISLVNQIFPNNIIVPESNSYGNQVCEYLTKSGVFYNIYQPKANRNSISKKPKFTYGIHTGPINRPLMIDALYTYITEAPETIKSIRTALELIGLVEKHGKIQADEGENDDLSMAWAFCAYVRMYDPPLGANTRALSEDIMDQMGGIADWNAEGHHGTTSPALAEIRNSLAGISDRIDGLDRANKLVNHHLKNNLGSLIHNGDGGSVIDITKLIHSDPE